MSRATPQYIALEKKVLGMITDLKPDFPGTIEFTVSDETYRSLADLLEQGQKIRYGEVIHPVINPRQECATSALCDIIYFSNTQGNRIGAVRVADKGLELSILDPSFQPYAAIIQECYIP